MRSRIILALTLLVLTCRVWATAQPLWVDISADDINVTQSLDLGYSAWEKRDLIPTEWVRHKEDKIHFPYTTGTPWIRLHVWNGYANKEINRRLYFDSTLIGQVTLWEEGSSSPVGVTGPGAPLSARAVKDRRAIFAIKLKPLEKRTLYLRVETKYLVSTEAHISLPYLAFKADGSYSKLVYFYIGGMTLLVLYNLIIGVFSRQTEFIVYSFFASAFAWTVLSLSGFLDTDLIPNDILVFSNYINIFTSSALISAAYFVPRFLNLELNFGVAKWFARILIVTSLICIVSDLYIQRWRGLIYFGYIIDFLLLVALLFYSYFGFYVWKKKRNRFALLFLLSWAVVFISIVIWFAPLYNIIEDNRFAPYSLLVGNLTEMVLLSMGLAQKFRFLEREKKTAVAWAQTNEHYQRLVKVLSHDIANIVASCRYHFDVIAKAAVADNLRLSVGKVRVNGDRLQGILRTVQQEILLRTVSQNLQLQAVNLKTACQEALQCFSWELQEKEIRVEFDVPENLEVWVHKDAFVNQVLMNLLSNSIKFSQSDTVLAITAEELKDSIVLRIKDQGVGLTPSQKIRLFQDQIPFSARVPQNKDGTGLGSTVVSAYLKLFYGTIEVESKHESEGPDHGTTVHLFFPKRQKS